MYDNWTPLHNACMGMGGHKDVVQYLVEMANCDISEYNSYIYSIPETQYVFTSAHLIRHNPVGSDSV